MVYDSNEETSFPHKLKWTNTQVSRIHKTFANGLSANIKFPKTQLSKRIQSGGLFIPYPRGIFGSFLPFNMVNSIANSYKKN